MLARLCVKRCLTHGGAHDARHNSIKHTLWIWLKERNTKSSLAGRSSISGYSVAIEWQELLSSCCL